MSCGEGLSSIRYGRPDASHTWIRVRVRVTVEVRVRVRVREG